MSKEVEGTLNRGGDERFRDSRKVEEKFRIKRKR